MKLNVLYFILISFSLIFVSCKKNNPSPQPTPVPIPQDTTGNGGGNNTNTFATLTINLSGMQNTNGKVNVALYNNSSSFNDPNQSYRSLFLNCTGNTMSIFLDSLPAGDYAFAIFHDENNNQQIDQNFLGIPTEGFAFSNNAMGNFGPPSWTQAKFTAATGTAITQNISLNFY